ncbi:MAG: glycoside hydrolase family 27 protein [Acutalibacteraceae bacterium]
MKPECAPMGWNSWDCYGAAVTEETVRKNAEYMAKNLKQYGYEYIVVDIQWYEPTAKSHSYNAFAPLCTDEYSRLIPAENRFPSSQGGRGFAPLADYIHSLGLKFGIHIMRGIPRQAVHGSTKIKNSTALPREIAKTDDICHWNTDMYGVDARKEGAREYYESLFELYASWGVDFVKCDDIARELSHAEDELILIGECLKNCGRDMVLSLSPGPAILDKADVYGKYADMWRITDDFWDKWSDLYGMFERAEKWAPFCGVGGFPDADMLPVGAINQVYSPESRTRFTKDEQITMMTLWSIFRSPLMIGGELTKLDEFTLKLLTNTGILKMHKDSRRAKQAKRWKETDGNEYVIWTADSTEKGKYLAVFNLGEADGKIQVDLESLGIKKSPQGFELWKGDRGKPDSPFTVRLKPHGAKAFYFE